MERSTSLVELGRPLLGKSACDQPSETIALGDSADATQQPRISARRATTACRSRARHMQQRLQAATVLPLQPGATLPTHAARGCQSLGLLGQRPLMAHRVAKDSCSKTPVGASKIRRVVFVALCTLPLRVRKTTVRRCCIHCARPWQPISCRIEMHCRHWKLCFIRP